MHNNTYIVVPTDVSEIMVSQGLNLRTFILLKKELFVSKETYT